MKTLRKEAIAPVFIADDGFIPKPENMEQGKIYISQKFHTSNHLCLCGCGNQTVLPFGKDGWSLTVRLSSMDGAVTITPSILQQWPCKSHYIITDGVANFV